MQQQLAPHLPLPAPPRPRVLVYKRWPAALAGDAPAAVPARSDSVCRRCFFLYRPRHELRGRIMQRVEQMVAGGLLEEAAALLAEGISAGSHSSSRAIGYRQALEILQVLHDSRCGTKWLCLTRRSSQ